MEYTTWQIIAYIMAFLFGIIAHFIKKKVKKETASDIMYYFRTHFGSTLTTLIGGLMALGLIWQDGTLSLITAFTAGFAADSLFNKVDK